jgi:Gas vesicle protein G
VGLLKELVLLPLAPVRGVVWVADRIADQVDREMYGEEAIRRRLLELQLMHDVGEIDDETFEQEEDELLEALEVARGDDPGR